MAGAFDQATIARIQQATDIIEVIGEHLNLTRKGREMVGLCPFHDDHKPSMNISPSKQIFKCFACGAGGDVFKFIQMRENLTFPQAVERLAQRAGIEVELTKAAKLKTQKQAAGINPNKLAKVNAWADKHFQKNLYDKQKGRDVNKYILERQITSASARKWHLGLALGPADLAKAASTEGIPDKLLTAAGLAVNKNGQLTDKFVNRLMFPITDVTGRVIAFGGRTLDEKGPKYVNSPTTALFDKSNSMYGLEQARHRIVSSELAIVVEGYTDCIMAHQFGCDNVIATLGTSFTDGHARILKRYAKKAVLVFDSDTAGIEAANRALEVCLSQRIDIGIASVPQGKDPCDFLLTAGREKFEKLVENAVDVLEFKWNRLTENFRTDETLAGRRTAIEEFMQTVATAIRAGNLPAIDRGLIVNRLSKIIGMDRKQINAELSKRLARAERSAGYKLENQKVTSVDLPEGLSAAAQREILEVLLNEPKLFESVKEKITDASFDVPILRQIAEMLFETLSSEPAASLTQVLAKIESVDIGNVVVELAQAGEQKGNFHSRLTSAIETLLRCQAREKTSQIKAVENQAQFLRSISENVANRNPHNLGMT